MHAERLWEITAASEARAGRGVELKARCQPGLVEHICNLGRLRKYSREIEGALVHSVNSASEQTKQQGEVQAQWDEGEVTPSEDALNCTYGQVQVNGAGWGWRGPGGWVLWGGGRRLSWGRSLCWV